MNQKRELRRAIFARYAQADPNVKKGQTLCLWSMIAWALLRCAYWLIYVTKIGAEFADSFANLLQGILCLVMILFAWILYSGIGRGYVFVPAVVGVFTVFQLINKFPWDRWSVSSDRAATACGILLIAINAVQAIGMTVLFFLRPYAAYCEAVRKTDIELRNGGDGGEDPEPSGRA